MSSKNEFSKKIQELTWEEFDYTEDFFSQNHGAPKEKAVSHLRRAAQKGARPSLSTHSTDAHIDEDWLDEEAAEHSYDGQLAVDVFETSEHLVITSAVAGVRAEDLDIAVNGDMITIKGMRRHLFADIPEEQYFTRECYWGGFSRSIILPSDVLRNEVEATLEHGVLTIRLPRIQEDSGRVKVVDISER